MDSSHRRSIRINDLRDPVLSDAARHALEEAERNQVELTSDAVMSAVNQIRRTPGTITKEIVNLADCFTKNSAYVADMTALGRAVIFNQIVRSASTMSRLNELLSFHPEINKIELESPIIVTGLARSGSNYLYSLLAADSRFRALSKSEASNPVPVDVIPTKKPIKSDLVSELDKLLPYFNLMYPSGPDDLRETHAIHLGLRPESMTESFNTLRTMLKVLQWRQPSLRWIIKSPIYSMHIESLMRIFPNATVVVTHRDPIPALVSDATMHAYVKRIFHQKVDACGIFARDAEIFQSKLESMVRNRNFLTSGKLVDIYFQSFIGDEIGTVRRIYDAVGIQLNDEERERLTRFKKTSNKRNLMRINYNLKGDFERDYNELRERYKFYTDRFPVDIEASF